MHAEWQEAPNKPLSNKLPMGSDDSLEGCSHLYYWHCNAAKQGYTLPGRPTPGVFLPGKAIVQRCLLLLYRLWCISPSRCMMYFFTSRRKGDGNGVSPEQAASRKLLQQTGSSFAGAVARREGLCAGTRQRGHCHQILCSLVDAFSSSNVLH